MMNQSHVSESWLEAFDRLEVTVRESVVSNRFFRKNLFC